MDECEGVPGNRPLDREPTGLVPGDAWLDASPLPDPPPTEPRSVARGGSCSSASSERIDRPVAEPLL